MLLLDGSTEALGLGSGIGCQTLLIDENEEATDLGLGIGYCIYARKWQCGDTHRDGDTGARNRFVYNGPHTALME